MVYALDTNVIIDYLYRLPSVIEQFEKTFDNGNRIVMPSVVNYEVLRGFHHTPSSHKEKVYYKILESCPIIEINPAIWNRAASIWAKLRKSGITIGEVDILVAAYCIENKYTLVTHNTRHFKNIDDLSLIDWH